MIRKFLVAFAAFVFGLFILVQVLSHISTDVHIEHTLNAPVRKVWETWNDPEQIKKWWGPKDFSAPVVKNDLRIDGTYLLSMQDPTGKVIYNTGTYTEIVELKKIVSRIAFADKNGEIVAPETYGIPGQWPNEITLTVEFTEIGDQTKVSVLETGIPAIMYLFAKMGWQQQFHKMDMLF